MHVFFVRDSWIERKGTEVKKAGNIGGGLKISVKNSFESPILFF
jgi:hypothetical protein